MINRSKHEFWIHLSVVVESRLNSANFNQIYYIFFQLKRCLKSLSFDLDSMTTNVVDPEESKFTQISTTCVTPCLYIS